MLSWCFCTHSFIHSILVIWDFIKKKNHHHRLFNSDVLVLLSLARIHSLIWDRQSLIWQVSVPASALHWYPNKHGHLSCNNHQHIHNHHHNNDWSCSWLHTWDLSKKITPLDFQAKNFTPLIPQCIVFSVPAIHCILTSVVIILAMMMAIITNIILTTIINVINILTTLCRRGQQQPKVPIPNFGCQRGQIFKVQNGSYRCPAYSTTCFILDPHL